MKIVQRKKKALTLIEIMLTVLIIAIGVIGAMSFRFYSTADAKKADVQVNAARIGSMLLENWKGLGGLSSYNPVTQFNITGFSSQFTIITTTSSSAPAANLSTKLNNTSYQIRDLANGVYYYVTLSYQTDTSATPTGVSVSLMALNASISWNQGYGTSGTKVNTISMTTYAD